MRKRGLRFYARMYRKILVQDLKSKMSYRADFVISTFGMIMTNLSGFVTFMILFHNFPTINGWDYHHMLFLYGFSLVALTPVQCFFDNNWNLRFMVQSGDFIKYCFRPVNVFFYFISEVFDVKGLGQLAFGIGTIILRMDQARHPGNASHHPEAYRVPADRVPVHDRPDELCSRNMLLDQGLRLRNGNHVPLQGLREIPVVDLRRDLQDHLYVHHPDRVHRLLPEPRHPDSGQRPAAVMDLAPLRPDLRIPELQVLDAGRSQIRLYGFIIF